MKIYFDMNIYNRVFDDQTQMRIRFETMAIDIIFELIEKEKYELVWSFILEFENSMNPYNNRKTYIKTLSTLAKYTIEPSEEIRKLAKSIMAKANAKEKDALHLASSVYGKCDYFITCDDKLIATIIGNRLDKELDHIKLFNPIDFIRKEMLIDVIE